MQFLDVSGELYQGGEIGRTDPERLIVRDAAATDRLLLTANLPPVASDFGSLAMLPETLQFEGAPGHLIGVRNTETFEHFIELLTFFFRQVFALSHQTLSDT